MKPWLIYWGSAYTQKHRELGDMMRLETLSQKMAKTNEIQIEALIPTPTGNLRPDLVVVSQGRVHVIDVTVRHEDTGYLKEGHRSKVEKYTPLMEILAAQIKLTEVTFYRS
jgi:hypothetical protein